MRTEMKNSEMKTIIRHIDRLTRNLNARGRRRHADGPDQQQKLKDAKYGAEVWAKKSLNAVVGLTTHCKFLYPQLIEKEEFDKLKNSVQKDLENGEKFVDAMKRLITFCDIAIKAQRG